MTYSWQLEWCRWCWLRGRRRWPGSGQSCRRLPRWRWADRSRAWSDGPWAVDLALRAASRPSTAWTAKSRRAHRRTRTVLAVDIHPRRHIAAVPLRSLPELSDDSYNDPFFTCVSYAEACNTYRLDVRLSVRPSVRLSHAGTVSKRLNVLSWFLHDTIAHSF